MIDSNDRKQGFVSKDEVLSLLSGVIQKKSSMEKEDIVNKIIFVKEKLSKETSDYHRSILKSISNFMDSFDSLFSKF